MAPQNRNRKLNRQFKQMQINRRNKLFLGFFLAFCWITLLCKIVDGVLLDIGLRNGEAHLGFWTDPNWIPKDITSVDYDWMRDSVAHHPNTIWFITQFTWITTILIIIIVSVRYFRYDGETPRWLRWIMTQRTLSWVASFDLMVGVVYWGILFRGLDDSFNKDLREFEITFTVFVHAVIPIMITVYSFVYLVTGKRASLLRTKFIWKGVMYATIYMFLYIILTIVWDDPYAVTQMHQSLVTKGWSAWASEIWKLPLSVVLIYIYLGIMYIIHNYVLLKYNRHYKVNRDYEANLLKDAQIQKYQADVRRDIMKRM